MGGERANGASKGAWAEGGKLQSCDAYREAKRGARRGRSPLRPGEAPALFLHAALLFFLFVVSSSSSSPPSRGMHFAGARRFASLLMMHESSYRFFDFGSRSFAAAKKKRAPVTLSCTSWHVGNFFRFGYVMYSRDPVSLPFLALSSFSFPLPLSLSRILSVLLSRRK